MTDTPYRTALIVGVGGGLSASVARTFAKAGTYDYSCSFHPYMTAKVVVA